MHIEVDLGSVVVVNDIDGIFRNAKGPIAPALTSAIQAVRYHDGTRIAAMTGSSIGFLPSIELDFYWAESGAVHQDVHGHRWVALEAHDFARRVQEQLRFFWRDGYVQLPSGKYIVLECNKRYASTCLLTGNPPFYANPEGFVTETMDEVEYWVRRSCEMFFPGEYALSRGRDTVYEFLDITHCNYTKRTRMESYLETLPEHDKVFYLGDSDSSDLSVMQLPRVIGVGFKNSGPGICEHVKRKGIYIDQDGPTGGTLTYYQRLSTGCVWSDE
ncbi:MAG: hypothetical protein Q8Q94_01845 [bacterium]|nr:hypothetical protein [bacterium]MDZ4299442.1 hypothetical protein [Candidatus Sungbacteria bacterium]